MKCGNAWMHAVAAPKAAKRWLPEWISDLLEKGLDVSVHETSEGRHQLHGPCERRAREIFAAPPEIWTRSRTEELLAPRRHRCRGL